MHKRKAWIHKSSFVKKRREINEEKRNAVCVANVCFHCNVWSKKIYDVVISFYLLSKQRNFIVSIELRIGKWSPDFWNYLNFIELYFNFSLYILKVSKVIWSILMYIRSVHCPKITKIYELLIWYYVFSSLFIPSHRWPQGKAMTTEKVSHSKQKKRNYFARHSATDQRRKWKNILEMSFSVFFSSSSYLR